MRIWVDVSYVLAAANKTGAAQFIKNGLMAVAPGVKVMLDTESLTDRPLMQALPPYVSPLEVADVIVEDIEKDPFDPVVGAPWRRPVRSDIYVGKYEGMGEPFPDYDPRPRHVQEGDDE